MRCDRCVKLFIVCSGCINLFTLFRHLEMAFFRICLFLCLCRSVLSVSISFAFAFNVGVVLFCPDVISLWINPRDFNFHTYSKCFIAHMFGPSDIMLKWEQTCVWNVYLGWVREIGKNHIKLIKDNLSVYCLTISSRKAKLSYF